MKNIITICLLIVITLSAPAFSQIYVDTNASLMMDRGGRQFAHIDTVLYAVLYDDNDNSNNVAYIQASYDYGATWATLITDVFSIGASASYTPTFSVIGDTLLVTNNSHLDSIFVALVTGGATSFVNKIEAVQNGVGSWSAFTLRNDTLVGVIDTGSSLAYGSVLGSDVFGAASAEAITNHTTTYSLSTPSIFQVNNGIGIVVIHGTTGDDHFLFSDGAGITQSATNLWNPGNLLEASGVGKTVSDSVTYVVWSKTGSDSLLFAAGYVNSGDSLIATDTVLITTGFQTTTLSADIDRVCPNVSVLGTDIYVIFKLFPDPDNNDSCAIAYAKATNTELGSIAFDTPVIMQAATGADTILKLSAPAYFPDNDVDIIWAGYRTGGTTAADIIFVSDTVAQAAGAAAIKSYYKGVYLKGVN